MLIKNKLLFCCSLVWMISMAPHKAAAQFSTQQKNSRVVIPLAGIWKFKLDPFFTGINSNGVQLMPQLPEEITLPGSTDQAGKGIKTQDMTSLRLTRLFEYKGAAWYEKEVYVPETWANKEIRLFLERVHWETSVWINGKAAGKQESLSAPHIYDISSLINAGRKNTIQIRVDNNPVYNIEHCHAVSAETQTNWNGIIGKIELQAFDKIHINDIQVYPQMKEKSARCHIAILNKAKTPVKGILQVTGTTVNTKPLQQVAAKSVEFSGSDSLILVTTDLYLGENMKSWDEFNPSLYNLTVSLEAEKEGVKNQDVRSLIFGMRQLAVEGTRFTINGRISFIRGTVNSAEFPLTGYPPADTTQWLRIFKTCKAYGVNLMRFHSWCPPEAAFEAADKLGIYLQVENSDWRFTIGKD